jgi:predicted MFS family arabinose efflux permease
MTHPTSNPERAARRPIPSVAAVGALFLLLGVLDLYRGIAPLLGTARGAHLAGDDVLVLAIGVAALVGGIYVIRCRNWARWLLALWMAFHVAISAGQPAKLGAHLVIFGFVAFLLFRSKASECFRATPSG